MCSTNPINVNVFPCECYELLKWPNWRYETGWFSFEQSLCTLFMCDVVSITVYWVTFPECNFSNIEPIASVEIFPI